MANPTMNNEFPEESQRGAVCHAQWDENNKEQPMTLERKCLEFKEFKLIEEADAEGTFEGYLSVFDNIDHDEDIVRAGAFLDTLEDWEAKGLMPAMFWLHDVGEPVGDWMLMKENEVGLYVKGRLWMRNATEAVRKSYNLIKSRTVKGLSIGYTVLKHAFKELEDGRRVRELLKLRLFEGSIVPFAANELAGVTAAKALSRNGKLATKIEFEKFLRDAGLSRKEAKALLADGYRGLRDADSSQEVESLIGSINNFRDKLKGD